MKVIIIEDEKLSAEHLTVLLQRTDQNIEVTHYFDSIKSSVKALKSGLSAELIFMDIHLADGNSFEIFKQFPLEIPVIFTTAFDQYAIPAFKQNSIDYLLKPIAFQDLKFAVEKFKKQRQTDTKLMLASLTSAFQQIKKDYKSRFMVKLGQTIDTILTDEIHHFHTKESMTFLVTNKGNQFNIDYSLEELESILNPKIFFRINRKIILNIQSIEKVCTYFNSRLSIATKFLDNEAKIVSRERVADFKKWLDN
jgi:DNA-binding LytR/AlgR family response regulator